MSDGSRAEASDAAAMPPRPPRWALAADTLAALLAGCVVFVAIAGRSFLIAPGQIVLPSASFLLFAAAALLLIRHVAQPRVVPDSLESGEISRQESERRRFPAGSIIGLEDK